MHLLHKKLLSRFESGELSFSQTRQELGVLQAVNERLHRQGAFLVLIQMAVFLGVLGGLKTLAAFGASFAVADLALLSAPASVSVPVLTALAYFFFGGNGPSSGDRDVNVNVTTPAPAPAPSGESTTGSGSGQSGGTSN